MDFQKLKPELLLGVHVLFVIRIRNIFSVSRILYTFYFVLTNMQIRSDKIDLQQLVRKCFPSESCQQVFTVKHSFPQVLKAFWGKENSDIQLLWHFNVTPTKLFQLFFVLYRRSCSPVCVSESIISRFYVLKSFRAIILRWSSSSLWKHEHIFWQKKMKLRTIRRYKKWTFP